jgi:hypothetical protein
MTYYDPLIAVWNTTTLPAGVTGSPLAASMSKQQKLDTVNAWMVDQSQNKPAVILSPSQIINAIVFADLAGLTQLQLLQLQILLSGSTVDVSAGTTIRQGLQQLFAGKTQTIANLQALVTPFDTPRITWCAANGYPSGASKGGLNLNDVQAAGL